MSNMMMMIMMMMMMTTATAADSFFGVAIHSKRMRGCDLLAHYLLEMIYADRTSAVSAGIWPHHSSNESTRLNRPIQMVAVGPTRTFDIIELHAATSQKIIH